MHGILRLRDRIHGHAREGWRERYGAVGTEEVLVGAQTPDDSAAINVFSRMTPARPEERRLDADRAANRPGDTAGA